MPAGQMDQQLKFQSESRTADGGGGAAVTWADVATVWARVVPASGREMVQADQVQATALYDVTIHNRSDITPGMRALWVTNGNRALNVRDMPDPGPRAIFRTFRAEEGVAI